MANEKSKVLLGLQKSKWESFEMSLRLEMRVPDNFFEVIDEWRRKQPDLPNRSEAIRRLVDLGLTR